MVQFTEFLRVFMTKVCLSLVEFSFTSPYTNSLCPSTIPDKKLRLGHQASSALLPPTTLINRRLFPFLLKKRDIFQYWSGGMGIRDPAQLSQLLLLGILAVFMGTGNLTTVLGEWEHLLRIGDGKGLGGKHVSRWFTRAGCVLGRLLLIVPGCFML